MTDEPYIGGYEFGFTCPCNERDVGYSYFDRGDIYDGSAVECPYCGATYRVYITKVDDGGDE